MRSGQASSARARAAPHAAQAVSGASALDANTAAVRPRGRPPTLSRERVLGAAVAISAADPITPISVAMVARHLGVSSAAIYKYFGNRDGFFQAASARLLEDFDFVDRPGAEPGDRIGDWLAAMRALFLRHPQLINLLTWEQGSISHAWEAHTLPIFAALIELEIAGEDLAKTALWILMTGMSAIQFEIHGRLFEAARDGADPPYVALGETGPRRVIAEFRTSDGYHDRLFAFSVQRLLDALRLHAAA